MKRIKTISCLAVLLHVGYGHAMNPSNRETKIAAFETRAEQLDNQAEMAVKRGRLETWLTQCQKQLVELKEKAQRLKKLEDIAISDAHFIGPENVLKSAKRVLQEAASNAAEDISAKYSAAEFYLNQFESARAESEREMNTTVDAVRVIKRQVQDDRKTYSPLLNSVIFGGVLGLLCYLCNSQRSIIPAALGTMVYSGYQGYATSSMLQHAKHPCLWLTCMTSSSLMFWSLASGSPLNALRSLRISGLLRV